MCLYILREIPQQKGMAMVMTRHPLKSVIKITSKKKLPELITFKFGSNEEDGGMIVKDTQRLMIEKAGKS